MSWLAIVSALGRLLAAVAPWAMTWFAGSHHAAQKARVRKLEAETAAKDDAIEVRDEINQMDDAAVRDRLDRWMRDR